MENITMRDAFFDSLYKIAKKDRNIILITADMGAPSLDKFKRDLSIQFINVGIAEENMVTVGTGLALSGKKVYICAVMPFVTSRCYEMLKVDLSLMGTPVTMIGVGAGFSYDDSGPTHHSTEDIAIIRTLPNMTILNPSDSVMAARFAEISYRLHGPSYVRLDRKILPQIYGRGSDFSPGLEKLQDGKDLLIIATGNMVHRALEVSERLKGFSIEAGVVDLYRLKPVNERLLLEYVENSKRVVTLEEHLISGGMGSIVAEILADSDKNYPLKRIGIRDRYYYAYGGRKNIQRLCGLDAESITNEVANWSGNRLAQRGISNGQDRSRISKCRR
jgi:transketolase